MVTKILGAAALGGALCVAAVSCGGEDSPIDPTPVCTFSITPGSLSFGSEGGTGQVAVTTQAGCTWSAAPSAGWIAIAGSNSGTGSGAVGYSVQANTAPEARTGSLTIGGQSHGVSQQGRAPTACSIDIAPAGAALSKDAATGTFGVTAPDGCRWTAETRAAWVTITSGAQGTGTGAVSYSVSRNTDPAERVGTITVADRLFTIRQTGDAGVCQYSVEPVEFRPCMAGGTVTAKVTTQAQCVWTATSSVPWLALSSGGSSGPGVITATFSDNYDAPRQGTVMVRWSTPTAGQNVHVFQAGCLYAVTQTTMTFTATGGTGTFNVLQQSDPVTCGSATQDRCVWSATSNVPWITIAGGMPRSGDNPVTFAVAANPSTAARSGRITVRDKVVVVTQTGTAGLHTR